MSVEQFIQNELSKLVVGLAPVNFEDDVTSFMELGLDSFGFIAFIQEIEQAYGFEFSTEDIMTPTLYTPRGMLAFIQAKVKAS